MTATSSSSYLPVMVIQLMKESERRFHILQPGVSSVAHIAQLSAASLLLGTLWIHCDHWPVLCPLRCPGVDCPLRTGGHETRGRAPPQHTGSRGPEDGWSGGGHIALQGSVATIRTMEQHVPCPSPAQTRWVKSLSDGETLMCILLSRGRAFVVTG